MNPENKVSKSAESLDLPTAEQIENWAQLYWSDPEKAEEFEKRLCGSFPQKLRGIADVFEERMLHPEREARKPGHGFSFVDVTTEVGEGTLNLMFDGHPVAWVKNLHIAQQIREHLSESESLKSGMSEAWKIIDVLYMDALDHNGESWPRAREWQERWETFGNKERASKRLVVKNRENINTERMIDPICKTEESVISLIRNLGEIGRRKYGASMDRSDLSPVEWLEHLQEELGGALQYAERAKRAANLMELAAEIIETFDREHGSDSAKQWIKAYRGNYQPNDDHDG